MNIQELLEIIKKEELYKYHAFQIGPPNNSNNIGTSAIGGEIYGIYETADSIWKGYTIGERGEVIELPNNYTETEACNSLLKDLRIKKESAKAFHSPKKRYPFKNREKWFD